MNNTLDWFRTIFYNTDNYDRAIVRFDPRRAQEVGGEMVRYNPQRAQEYYTFQESPPIDQIHPNWRDVFIPSHRVSSVIEGGGVNMDSGFGDLFSCLYDTTSGLNILEAFLLCIAPLFFLYIFISYVINMRSRGVANYISNFPTVVLLILALFASTCLAELYPHTTLYSDRHIIEITVLGYIYDIQESNYLFWIILGLTIGFICLLMLILGILKPNTMKRIFNIGLGVLLTILKDIRVILHMIYNREWYKLWEKFYNHRGTPTWFKKILGISSWGVVLIIIPLVSIIWFYLFQ